MKNRTVIQKRVNSKKNGFKFQDGFYILSEKEINNIERGGRIRGAEIIYHEGNPNAIGIEGAEDSSETFLDALVIANALEQTSEAPKYNLGDIFEMLSPLRNPQNVIWGIFALAIIWAIISGGLGWT